MSWKSTFALIGSLLVCIGLFVFCRVEGGFLPWFLFYFSLALGLYEILVWVFSLRGITVQRAVSATRLSAGQSLAIRVRVLREGLWPTLWLAVSEELPVTWSLHAEDTRRVVQPLWSPVVTLTYRVHALTRGLYQIGDTRLETGDLFGMQRRHRVHKGHQEIIVYPQVVPVRGWSGNSPDETTARQPTSHITEESSNVMGVRDYVPGDKLSRIHWKASARNASLLSKEFELHVSSDLVFLADASRQNYPFGRKQSIFELEMIITASLMKFCYETHRRFGLMLHGRTIQQYAPGTGEALFLHCMEALAIAEPDGAVPFAESLVRTAQEMPRGATLVIVSPQLNKEAAIAIQKVAQRVGVQWFVPVDSGAVEGDSRSALSMMQTAGARVYLISNSQQLAELSRGGARIAVHP